MNYQTRSGIYLPLHHEWNHINIVWQKYVALKFFINFHLVHTVSPMQRFMVFPTTNLINDTSSIVVANCSMETDSYLLIKDLQFGTNLKEDWEHQIPGIMFYVLCMEVS